MDSGRLAAFPFLVLLLLAGFASSATFISHEVLEPHGPNGRNLLQQKKDCPVDLQSQNYTIITSKCKGPQYSPKLCCDALKEFACPFSNELNDGTNNCASTMFSYINIYGRYPPGLFASECREGKEGLECPDEFISSKKNQISSSHSTQGVSMFMIFVMAIAVVLAVF